MRSFLLFLYLLTVVSAVSGVQFPVSAAGELNIKVIDPGSGKRKEIRASAYLDAPYEKVWQTLVHYEHYTRFLPRIASSKVQRRTPEFTIATMTLDLPFPMNGTWYTNRYTQDKTKGMIRWKMVRGTFKSSEGEWVLTPRGKGTVVRYTLHTDPGIPMIPQFLVDKATQQMIPKVLHSVEAYAQKL